MSATGTGGTHHQRLLAALFTDPGPGALRLPPRPRSHDAWRHSRATLWWEL